MVPGEFWDLVPVDASRGRALVRPGLLPIGRIPFREPPCAGTQVGEGIALLLMQFTDYRCFFWPSRAGGGFLSVVLPPEQSSPPGAPKIRGLVAGRGMSWDRWVDAGPTRLHC